MMINSLVEEEVNGTIIGEIFWPYQFWVEENRPERQTKRGVPLRLVYKGFFANDEQAIAFLREKFPEESKGPVEMRVFDKW